MSSKTFFSFYPLEKKTDENKKNRLTTTLFEKKHMFFFHQRRTKFVMRSTFSIKDLVKICQF